MSDHPTTAPHFKRQIYRHSMVWGLLVGCGITVYANSLSGPFIFDDEEAIVGNPALHQLWPPQWLFQAWSPQQGAHARIVVNFSFVINYALGGLDVWGYHLFNIAVHILCALVLFGVVRITLQSKHLIQKYGDFSIALAAIIALIWLVHPLQTQCVNYILQRSESIMGLCYLSALYSAGRFFRQNESRIWAIVSIACCTLGMASKEVMVSAPVIILLYDRIFYSDTFCQIFQQRWRFYIGLSATWLILLALLLQHPHQNTIGFSSTVGSWDYTKNQFLMLCTYLRLSVWPHPLTIDYGFPVLDLPFTQVAPYAALILALIMSTVITLRSHPRMSFLGVCFFAFLAPTSSFIPIVNEVGAERRMYLSLAAFMALIVILVFECVQHRLSRQNNWRICLCVFLLVIGLGWTTIRRNQDYRSRFSIWKNALNSNPRNARALNNLGHILSEEDRFEEAIPLFQKALELIPGYLDATYNLAYSLTETGRPDEAIPYYESAIKLNPEKYGTKNWRVSIHHGLGTAFLKQGQRQKAILHLKKALEFNPGYILTLNNLGVAFLQARRYSEAIDQFQQILKLSPNNTSAISNLELALQLQKEIKTSGSADIEVRLKTSIPPVRTLTSSSK